MNVFRLAAAILLPASLAMWLTAIWSFAQAEAQQDLGCKLSDQLTPQELQQLIDRERQKLLANPPEVRPTDPNNPYVLEVKYGSYELSGCPVKLRSYNGKPVGETIKARPGETIYIVLRNNLPQGVSVQHPQPKPNDHEHGFTFNVTNLHTHGLNTAPQGRPDAESDNVLLEIIPGQSQKYAIHIHEKHPAGTFWYHAHVHGSTSIQVSSGMAGALIIEGGADANGGLDTVPEITAAMNDGREKIFILQQFNHDPDGTLEQFDSSEAASWKRRLTYINGQLTPTIRMRPGEVQRWRFIHAGVQESVSPSLDEHKLYQIAEDGIALGRLVAWQSDTPIAWPSDNPADAVRNFVLGPGYRADFLVQASMRPGTYVLRDDRLPASRSIQASKAVLLLARESKTLTARELATRISRNVDKPESVLAFVEIAGDPLPMLLPASARLADRRPTELMTITDDEVDPAKGGGARQKIDFGADSRHCEADGNCTNSCSGAECDITRYMVNDRVFLSSTPPLPLKINTASEWTLTGLYFPHPFHIHVNPFQLMRPEPGPDGKLAKQADGNPILMPIWKDTISLPSNGTAVKIRSRYLRFNGKFVLHCHILDHEDQGMMALVEIGD
jgi:FtsP/CotA-like multicopper oxidase with cupredoxin domain